MREAFPHQNRLRNGERVSSIDLYQLLLSFGERKEQRQGRKADYWLMVSSNSFHHCGDSIREELGHGRYAEAYSCDLDKEAEKLGRNQRNL